MVLFEVYFERLASWQHLFKVVYIVLLLFFVLFFNAALA